MSDKVFVDTNILIYAHDLDAGRKHETAKSLLRDLWENHTGVISTQVLQEFYVNVTRKITQPITASQARGIINAYAAWRVEIIQPSDVIQASEIQERYRLSFWDSMIVVTAAKSRADILVTEDLNPGQIIEGVLVKNPF
ncbi:MAG: PIN domain-containing protein [Chromatiales bacterium]|jgi:predicted nucleic acid-binding protein